MDRKSMENIILRLFQDLGRKRAHILLKNYSVLKIKFKNYYLKCITFNTRKKSPLIK